VTTAASMGNMVVKKWVLLSCLGKEGDQRGSREVMSPDVVSPKCGLGLICQRSTITLGDPLSQGKRGSTTQRQGVSRGVCSTRCRAGGQRRHKTHTRRACGAA
jgi:hypothetical protein